LKTDSSAQGKRRIGIIGGTFDPIHYGHLVIAEEVRATLDLSEMVFIPTGQPPHKPKRIITAAQHRVAMVELAIASNSNFTLSRIEANRPGPSYTVETLQLLHELWGENTDIYYVIGWDSLEELHLWHDPQGILKLLTHIVAVRRPGYAEELAYQELLEERLPGIRQRLQVVSTPQLDISATDLRRRVAEKRPIKYQTPDVVEQYITQHGLYQEH
jgi:nicotinate-nucleotide adenylyltransferase